MPSPASGDDADVARLLVEALRGHPLTVSGETSTARLVAAANHHGVLIPLYRALARSGEYPGDLARLVLQRRASTLRIKDTAPRLSAWLRDASIDHAVLKGPTLAAAYPDGDRSFVDLDILVSPADMAETIATFVGHGAEVLAPGGWPRSDGVGQIPIFVSEFGITVDLHADLIHHADVRHDFRFSAEDLLRRADRNLQPDDGIATLDRHDILIHVALHAAISGGDRLLWLADLDALVRRGDLRWAAVIDRAREARAALVVAVMLERSRTLLGTPIPGPARRLLRRRGRLWLAIVEQFERRRPSAASYGRSVRGQVLVRATRDTTLTSLRTLVRLLWTDVIVFVWHDRQHPWRTRLRQRTRP